MKNEIEIVYSPLQQCCTKDGHTLDIRIFRAGNEADWLLEIVDVGGSSTVWDDRFATDQDALAEALQAIDDEGVASFLTETALGKL